MTKQEQIQEVKNTCKRCGYDRFATHPQKGILICAKCGHPKTRRGIEKTNNQNESIGVTEMQGYKPSDKAIEVYGFMQWMAKIENKSIGELAKEMGFSCGYEWQKALMQEAEN